MESRKPSQIINRNLHRMYSNYSKFTSLSKLYTQDQKNNCSKQNITLKNSIQKNINNSEMETKKRQSKIACKKNQVLKTFVFQQSDQHKIKTENSSLSCSNYKQKVGNSTMVRENPKNISRFSSIPHQRSTHKIQNKSTSTKIHSNEKKTVKLKSCPKNSEMQTILNRTKSVLEGWMKEKSVWQQQKQSYEIKIQTLHCQIDILKSRITLKDRQSEVRRFHDIRLQ